MPTHGYAANRPSRLVLAAIIGGHAAVLTALMLAKMDVYPKSPLTRMEVTNIPIEPPPEPLPEPKAEPEPRTMATVTAIRPPIPILNQDPVFPTSPPNVDDFRPVNPGPTNVYAELVTPKLPTEPVVTFVPPKPTPIGVKPQGNPGRWVTNDDYPDAALRNEEQGRTAFRLDVGADGRPTACSVTASSGSRVLDGAACKLLMRRARFVAGRDGDGVAVGGSYANSFNWKIPEG